MKKLIKIGGVLILRIFNVVSSGLVGVVLARGLTLDSRGYVAVISSTMGVAVVLISSPKGEEILRNQNTSNDSRKVQRASLNIIHLFVILVSVFVWLYIEIGIEIGYINYIWICAIILLSSINSLKQATLFHKFRTFGNQLIITAHSVVLCFFLVILFLTSLIDIEKWLLSFLITEALLLISLLKLESNTRLDLSWKFSQRRTNALNDSKKNILEQVSVYQAAFFLQILTIIVSLTFPTDSVALFAVGLTLVSLVSIPAVPYHSQILSEPDTVYKALQNLSLRVVLLIIILISTYTLFLKLLYQNLIPILYGQKYNILVDLVPIIVMSGLVLSILNLLLTLFRGSREFFASFGVFLILFITFISGLSFLSKDIFDVKGIFTLFFCSLIFSLFSALIFLRFIIKRRF